MITISAKKKRILYWIATIWLALGLTSAGIVQLIKMEAEVASFTQLGYPVHLLTILGTWKILGVIAILVPKFPLLKEWAYAGIFFNMTGAMFAHMISTESATDLLGPDLFAPLFLLVLTMLSWYTRPDDRKIK